jgi:hypothetical protein
VASTVIVGVPDDMCQVVKRFETGETVKVKVFMGYWHGSRELQLVLGSMKQVTKVRIVVI